MDGGVLGRERSLPHHSSWTPVLPWLLGFLTGGVGVLSKKSQEDSQEVVCRVDWLSIVRATEEPFR